MKPYTYTEMKKILKFFKEENKIFTQLASK